MSNVQSEIDRHENVTPDQKKNQLIETHPEINSKLNNCWQNEQTRAIKQLLEIYPVCSRKQTMLETEIEDIKKN